MTAAFGYLFSFLICFCSSLLLLLLTYSGLFPDVYRNFLNYEFIWLGTSSVGFLETLFKVHTFREDLFGFYLPLRDHTNQGRLTLNIQLGMFWHQHDSVNSRYDPAWVWACAQGLSEEAIFFISLCHRETKLKQVHSHIILEAIFWHIYWAYCSVFACELCSDSPVCLGLWALFPPSVHMWSIKTHITDNLQSVDTPGQCQAWQLA